VVPGSSVHSAQAERLAETRTLRGLGALEVPSARNDSLLVNPLDELQYSFYLGWLRNPAVLYVPVRHGSAIYRKLPAV
jgi:hypothetical protein